jgi:CxxC-x17-CxxC domain-containing protein
MDFQDKVLKCIDCGGDFIFTAGEQLFFHDKQFKNEPKRCKACKTKRVSILGAPPVQGQSHRYTKVETQATCSGCGKQTTVPFRPTQGRLLPRMFPGAQNRSFRLIASNTFVQARSGYLCSTGSVARYVWRGRLWCGHSCPRAFDCHYPRGLQACGTIRTCPDIT